MTVGISITNRYCVWFCLIFFFFYSIEFWSIEIKMIFWITCHVSEMNDECSNVKSSNGKFTKVVYTKGYMYLRKILCSKTKKKKNL